MTTEHEHNPGRRAADDVAADMERRLEELGEHIDQVEREERRLSKELVGGIAGDHTAIHEGPLSAGATPSAAEPERPNEDDD